MWGESGDFETVHKVRFYSVIITDTLLKVRKNEANLIGIAM